MQELLTAVIAAIRGRLGYNGLRQLSDFSDASAAFKALTRLNIALTKMCQGDNAIRHSVLSTLFGREIKTSRDLYLYEVKAFLAVSFPDKKSKEMDTAFESYLEEIAQHDNQQPV